VNKLPIYQIGSWDLKDLGFFGHLFVKDNCHPCQFAVYGEGFAP
jgi:hypothetical protein